MAVIQPFKAIRPVRDKVHLVATRPVYTYKKYILKAKLEENPYTFIRIINPEYGQVHKTKANSRERFLQVKAKFEEFRKRNILIQDERAMLYLYRQTKNNHAFIGVIAGASIEEYNEDLIKKHEATLTTRESVFTEYLEVVGFNAEPVLLTYSHHPKLEQVYELIMSERPEYEFSTTDEVKHELWLVDPNHEKELITLFAKIPCTYIADGHHRSASSASLAAKTSISDKIKYANLNFFLACFMDEKRLNILEFNRLVKSMGSIKKDDFLKELKQCFNITPLNEAQKPSCEHQITMNLKNQWYLLECKLEIIDPNHPVACLDTEILTRHILTPLLGIHDLKTDANIEFISGNLGLSAISEPIRNGKCELGFVLYPTSMEQVKRVADHQLIMPPKSTWVEPKLRSGLTIYSIRE